MVHSSPESGLIVAAAQSLMYESRIAALATLESAANHPYASLVAIAPDVDGAPVFLISNLALHTRNLEADSRASVLLTERTKGDPLNSGRVSLMGRAMPVDDPKIRRGFLGRHPEAAGYADFADFRFWRLRPERAHYVGGFGRIVTLQATQILLPPEQARLWAGAETEIEALNAERPELIQELAGYCEAEADGWRIATCDPHGCDLSRGSDTRRVAFAAKLDDPAGLEAALQATARRKAAEGA
jgi:putative heme iron utilization protein